MIPAADPLVKADAALELEGLLAGEVLAVLGPEVVPELLAVLLVEPPVVEAPDGEEVVPPTGVEETEEEGEELVGVVLPEEEALDVLEPAVVEEPPAELLKQELSVPG